MNKSEKGWQFFLRKGRSKAMKSVCQIEFLPYSTSHKLVDKSHKTGKRARGLQTPNVGCPLFLFESHIRFFVCALVTFEDLTLKFM